MAVPAPSSEVDICNLALIALKQDKIGSIDAPSTEDERTMALVYPAVRQELIRSYIWNFSTEYATVSRSGAGSAYADSYTLPNDCMRVRVIGTINPHIYPEFEYEVVGRQLEFDNNGAATLKIKYSKDVTDVKKFDPLFRRFLYLQIASDVAYHFTLKPGVLSMIESKLLLTESKAVSVDGQESKPVRVQRSKIQSARRGLGTRNNNNPMYFG